MGAGHVAMNLAESTDDLAPACRRVRAAHRAADEVVYEDPQPDRLQRVAYYCSCARHRSPVVVDRSSPTRPDLKLLWRDWSKKSSVPPGCVDCRDCTIRERRARPSLPSPDTLEEGGQRPVETVDREVRLDERARARAHLARPRRAPGDLEDRVGDRPRIAKGHEPRLQAVAQHRRPLAGAARDHRQPERQALDQRRGERPLAPGVAVEPAAPGVSHLEVDRQALEELLLHEEEVLPVGLVVLRDHDEDDPWVVLEETRGLVDVREPVPGMPHAMIEHHEAILDPEPAPEGGRLPVVPPGEEGQIHDRID